MMKPETTLKERLVGHLIASGMNKDKAEDEAIVLLQKRGQMDKMGKLTKAGQKAQDLGVAGRAKARERAAKKH